MQRLPHRASMVAAALVLSGAVAHAQSDGRDLTGGVDSAIQSPARPFGLNIVGKVKTGASDSASAAFSANALPVLRSFANTNLREGVPMSGGDVALHRIDPARIRLKTAADVRCYFVGEGAGYHNSLGFNTAGGDAATFGNDPKLIFPDASTGSTRTTREPLRAGDFVNMGSFAAATQLHFFLMANAVDGGRNVYSTNHLNPDGLVHAVAFTLPGTPYLLIGFEDLFGGGDRDYNDLLFTLDIGTANVDYLSAPEPAAWLGLAGCLALALRRRRRHG